MSKKAKKASQSMETHKEREREHDFTLVLSGITELTSEVENALFDCGCDDATLSIRSGRAYLTFSRAAATLKDAILSAIRDVQKADIGADVLRLDVCDLVTQADIARRISRSRQQVYQFISGQRGPGGFPPPVCRLSDEARESALWLWCEVAIWLWENDMLREDALREAQHVAIINSVLDLVHQRQIDPALAEEVLQSVARDESAA